MTIHAYTLLAKLTNLILVGQDDDGDLEFYGTFKQWHDSARMEEVLWEEANQLEHE